MGRSREPLVIGSTDSHSSESRRDSRGRTQESNSTQAASPSYRRGANRSRAANSGTAKYRAHRPGQGSRARGIHFARLAKQTGLSRSISRFSHAEERPAGRRWSGRTFGEGHSPVV